MGVDIFSAGSIDETEPGVEAVRYEDPALGVYKKLLIKDNRLTGMILVGDIEDEHILHGLDAQRDRSGPAAAATAVPAAGREIIGLEVAEMPDSETICGCKGVRKGDIIEAIHEHGITTLAQLKERTRASTGCGSCAGLCQKLLRAVAPDFQEETKTTLCACVPFSYERLRDIVRGAEAQIGGRSSDSLRQPQGLRGLQAGAELHAGHAVVRRSRRGPVGALHQRPGPRQHPERRNIFRGAAHARRRDDAG